MVTEETAVVEMRTKEIKKEKKERKKAEKKKNKKRKKPDDDSGSESDTPLESTKSKDSKKEGKDEDKIPNKKKKKDAKSRLKSKKEEKTELMKKIPLENEDGIAYTKFQIRQMMKRVKRGLSAVATPKELDEKRQNEARLRREEEAELAGLASTRNATGSDEDDSDADDEEVDDGGNIKDNENDQPAKESSPASTDICTAAQPVTNEGGKPKKKPKQNKPIPADYVCAACKNRHEPLHWIYDCPFKVTVRGTNKKKKKDRGFNDPDAKKVFVSGLPFDVKAKAVEDFFSVARNCGTVAGVRLVTFADTKRCNGQAYVSFDTDEGAQNAIKLSGTTLDAEALASSTDGNDSKNKRKDGESPAKRKELKLKVSKVLNRRKTTRAGRA
jgi:hypothetical protein